MNNLDFLSEETLKMVFDYDSNGCLKRNESYYIEYKEGYSHAGFDNKYIRAMSGLANSCGGYIIFGIDDVANKLKGLTAEQIQLFSSIDKDRIREKINKYLSHDIQYEYITHSIDSKTFGVIHVKECSQKPVMCVCDAPDKSFKSNDIFYRYQGEISKIKSDDLQNLIEQKRLDEQNKWINLLGRIAKIDSNKVFIIDIDSKEIIDINNNSISVDSKIIDRLCYINEYSKISSSGTPAIKLVGKVLVGKEIAEDEKKEKAILEKDIIKIFLEQKCSDPMEYIKTICTIQGSLPLYYFIKEVGVESFVRNFNLMKDSIRNRGPYEKIKKMLCNHEKTNFDNLPEFRTDSQKRKRSHREYFLKLKKDVKYDVSDIKNKLESIRCIDKYDVRKNIDFIIDYLLDVKDTVYSYTNELFSKYRWALLWVDEAMYRDEATSNMQYINFREIDA